MRIARLLHGPHVSVSTLQAWCPGASRRALAAWQRAERHHDRQRLRVLRWSCAGRVWAMDFSHAPQRIDGQYRALLHVRDLASRCVLAALPVPRLSTSVVCGLLRALCADADPPLVLKVDNGSAFRSEAVRAWAHAVGTRLLYSPPRTPRYNGAIEASIGALTTRAHHAAVAHGHPEYWTCDDVEGARLAANGETGGRTAHTPWHCWRQQSPITARERRRFLDHCAAMTRTMTRNPRVHERIAIVDTLQRLGYVSITRRADLVHQ
jgi:transposase InsO family protein